MISKINKIKNLGLVLSDYSWNAHLPANSELLDFKRYNLIYGWNGSGKTTFSKLYDALEEGELKSINDLEYEVEDGEKNKYKNGEPFNQKIRVFNQDYIENNLKIRDGKAKSITLILGDINKEIVEQIENDQNKLKEKNDELKKINELLEQKTKTKGKTFTEIAKTIYVAITGGAIRNYRRDNAESDFTKLNQKELLQNDKLNEYTVVVKQNSKPVIDTIKKIEFNSHNGQSKELWEFISDLTSEAKRLLAKTIDSQVIERLKSNQNISNWVETGLNIHNEHKSTDCEFCGQILPKDRLLDLSKHFNEADKELKQNVGNLLINFSQVYSLIDKIDCPDEARFYDELQEDYKTGHAKFDQEKSDFLETLEKTRQLIEGKKFKTTESLIFNENLNTQKFTESLEVITDLIGKHNKKTSAFEIEKDAAINKLKNHYLSTIFDEVKSIEKEIQNSNSTISKLNTGDKLINDDLGIIALKKRIVENQAKISSTHKACEDINKGLATFLGREELIFEPHKTKMLNEKGEEQEVDDGYVIKRGGKLANNLSEGEKTAIAFVYFTIHLKDQNFNLQNGIIVIDDPVSSLDSNSLFQAFAFLKNAVKDAEQIFILTHNFDFLKLLLNWIKHVNHGKNNSYYMLKNCYINNIRCAYLDKMDKELCEYESEYHYLFKILKDFESDGSIGQAYPIPNIARKVLDTFLLFRVPCGGSTYSKLEKMKETTSFDENKLTAIYKFTNDQSHITGSGFDPSLVPETQKNVKYILEMIEAIFPEHYKILQESI